MTGTSLEELEAALLEVQTHLRDLAIARDPRSFRLLLDGQGGIGGWYGLWRRLSFWRRGQKFADRHEERSDD